MASMSRRHAVIGGAGFIGSHIVQALVERGDEVVILDDFSTGKRDNVKDLRGVDVRELDIASDSGLAVYLNGVDTVFHQAAIPSVPLSVQDPETSHGANVNGTLNLLMAARAAGVRRVVYASSCAVYGDTSDFPTTEDTPAKPMSPYGAQKYFAEVYMQVFWRTYGLETVSLRYFNVFGPRQDASSHYSGVIAQFIPAVLESRQPTIYGDGSQSRDFVYVGNVVAANLKAAEVEGAAGEVFNVACGDRITVKAMFEAIQKIAGSQLEPAYEAPRKGDILHSQADVSKAQRLLGWTASIPFAHGLEKTIDWYRATLPKRTL